MTYSVAPHLEYFTIPLADFMAARPEFEGFGVGAYIFSLADPTPRILLLQRAWSDSMPGCWEGPGGACEPESDKTLLDSLIRETLEESGLHVSHVVDLVAVDCWEHHRRSGGEIRIVKYSFIVEVYEGSRDVGGQREPTPTPQIPIKLDATEHQTFDWATENNVQVSIQSTKGPYKFPLPSIGHQAPNILRAFELHQER
jgi:8-oxo-dGTP pyrophosphatase MutT (NUDIX family)